MSEITDFAASTQATLDAQSAALDLANTSLTNILADEAGQAKMIQDLKDQLNGKLSPEDEAALIAVSANAQAKLKRTQDLSAALKEAADAIPDPPPPPPKQ